MKTAIIAAAALALSAPHAYSALANASCTQQINTLQPQWDRNFVPPSDPLSGQVGDNFRIAKDLCAKGREKEATQYLDVVRSHLRQPKYTPRSTG